MATPTINPLKRSFSDLESSSDIESDDLQHRGRISKKARFNDELKLKAVNVAINVLDNSTSSTSTLSSLVQSSEHVSSFSSEHVSNISFGSSSVNDEDSNKSYIDRKQNNARFTSELAEKTKDTAIVKLNTKIPLNQSHELLNNLKLDNHYSGLHPQTELSKEKLNSLTDRINAMGVNEILQKITQRIGSESENATVWKLLVDDHFIAVKISKINVKKTINEFKIAQQLTLVDKCHNYVLRSLTTKNGRVSINKNEYEAQLIFMELASGDLSQLLTSIITEDELDQYINQVFDSLEFLTRQGIRHGDLHIGNVFIIPDNGGNRAVIGDFGSSENLKGYQEKKISDHESSEELVDEEVSEVIDLRSEMLVDNESSEESVDNEGSEVPSDCESSEKEPDFSTASLEDISKFFTTLKSKLEELREKHYENERIKSIFDAYYNKIERFFIIYSKLITEIEDNESEGEYWTVDMSVCYIQILKESWNELK